MISQVLKFVAYSSRTYCNIRTIKNEAGEFYCEVVLLIIVSLYINLISCLLRSDFHFWSLPLLRPTLQRNSGAAR